MRLRRRVALPRTAVYKATTHGSRQVCAVVYVVAKSPDDLEPHLVKILVWLVDAGHLHTTRAPDRAHLHDAMHTEGTHTATSDVKILGEAATDAHHRRSADSVAHEIHL